MTTIHDKSSFIPGGNVQNSHRNSFLGVAEGDNVQLDKSRKPPSSRSSKPKRSGAMPIGKGKTSTPRRGSMKKITPS